MTSPTQPETLTAASLPRTRAPRIRVGVLVNSHTVQRWIAKTFEEISRADFVDPLLVVVNSGKPARRRAARSHDAGNVLLTLWRRLDYVLFRNEHDAFQPVDISAGHSCPVIEINPVHDGGQELLSAHDLAALKSAEIDVLLELGFGYLPAEIHRCARYGLWSYPRAEHDYSHHTHLPLGDMYANSGTYSAAILVRNAEGERLIGAYQFRTDFSSLYRNQNCVAWKAPELLLKPLADLHRGNEQCCIRSASAAAKHGAVGSPSRNKPLRGNLRMLGFVVRWVAHHVLAQLAKYMFREKWFVAYRRGLPLESPAASMRHFNLLWPPAGQSYADPFVVQRDGKTYLFFEDYPINTGKGVIACAEIDEQGTCGRPQAVLVRDYHLSYPFLFEWQGRIYLIPETRANRTIEVYGTDRFPFGWKLQTVLIDNIPAVDSTLVQYGSKWWLFTWTFADHDWNGGLLLFYSDSPFGRWTPHPKNPVVTDLRRSRPAGALFMAEGHLIRPGQDCSGSYGRAVCLNRVEALSETDYDEVPWATIEPDWFPGNLGTHTYNQSPGLQVVDGRIRICRLPLISVLANRMHESAGRRHHTRT